MKSIHAISTRRTRPVIAALSGAFALCCHSHAAPTLLTDANFENNPLVPISTVLGNFNAIPGAWGQESSSIVGSVGNVSPLTPVKMLQMNANTGVTTQTGQAVNVSALQGYTITFGALFNTENLGAAQAGVSLSFYDGPNSSSALLATAAQGLTLDNNPASWQNQWVSLPVPATAQYAFAQVYFSNASLVGAGGNALPGFVDETYMGAAVPEPGSYALMAGGLALIGLRLRKRPQSESTINQGERT